MNKRTWTCALLAAVSILTIASGAIAQEEKDVRGFPELARRAVTFWSDGTMLAGDITYPKDIKDGDKLPCIVMCHGWGGVKRHLNFEIAPRFAKEGYVVFTFDYRGWGESNSRLVMMDKMPKPDADGNVTVTARAVRELVDPIDQQEDIYAAITFVEGEDIVDANRIGIWGSSFGGGHVIWRAANDKRVKCVAAQVGAMDQRDGLLATYSAEGREISEFHAQRIARIRGEIEPVPTDADKPEGLTGTPYYDRFYDFIPVEEAHKITVPVMIIDAELEHYFDNKRHGGKVYSVLKGKVPVEYHLIKGMKHYDVYTGEGLNTAMKLEIPWYNEHLKGAK